MNDPSTLWDEGTTLLRRWTNTGRRALGRHGFFRSRNHRMIAGVCGGLAERFDVPVSMVRLVFILVALPGFFHAAIAYAILAVLMPERGDSIDSII